MEQLDSVPLSARVRRAIEEMLQSGGYKPGMRLPSEAKLAKQLGVSRVTLRETLKELEQDGLVVRQHGLGTFVAHKLPVLECAIELNLGVTEMIRRSGLQPSTSKAELVEDHHDEAVAEIFGDKAIRLLALRRVRNADNRPVVVSLDILPWRPDLDFSRLSQLDASVYQFMEEEMGIAVKVGKAILEPVRASSSVAADLQIAPGSLVLLLDQVDYSLEGEPVLVSHEYWEKDVIKFVVTRTRPETKG